MGILSGVSDFLRRNDVTPTTTNSADGLSGLASTLQSAGFNITVGGRSLKHDLDPEQIEELYSGIAQAAIQLTAYKVAKMIEDNMATVDPKNPREKLEGALHPYLPAITAAPYSNLFFWQAITEYILTFGNAYVFKGETKLVDGNYALPTKFQLLEPHNLSTVKDRTTKKVVGYKYKKEGSDLNGDYLKENVLKVHNLNIFDLENGRGLLASIVRNLLIEDQATLLQYAALINGTSIPGFVSVDPETPPDVFTNIQNAIMQRWTGVKTDKSGAPVVMKGGKIDWTAINVEYEKLAMDGLRDGNNDTIRARLGVSKTIMGQEESGVTRDTSETMTENFEDNTCLPLAQTIVDMFSQDFINYYPKVYATKPLELSVLIPDRRKAEDEHKLSLALDNKASAVQRLVAAGFDPTMALEAVGLEDINFIGLPEPRVKAETATPQNNIKVDVHNHDMKGKEDGKQDNDNHSEEGRVRDGVLNAYEESHGCHTNAFDPAMMTPDQVDLATSIAAIDERLLPLYLTSLDTDIPEVERRLIQQELQNLLYGYSTSTTATIAPSRYLDNIRLHGGTGSFKMTPKTFNELLDLASKAALSHLDTVDANVKSIVAEAAKEELGEDIAKKRVELYFKDTLTKYESQRLAVDQSRRIYGEAKLLSDKQFLDNNDLKAVKVLRNYGPTPCPFCKAAEGKRVPVEANFYDLNDVITAHDDTGNVKAFRIGYAPVSSAKIHPFCGCDYELIIEDN